MLLILSWRQSFPSSVTGFTDVSERSRNADTEPNAQLGTEMLLPGSAGREPAVGQGRSRLAAAAELVLALADL